MLFLEFSGMIYVGMEFKLFLIITLFAYGWYNVVDFCHATLQIKEFSNIFYFFERTLMKNLAFTYELQIFSWSDKCIIINFSLFKSSTELQY